MRSLLRADPAADTVQPGKPPINKCEHLEFTRVSFRQRRVVQTQSAAETGYEEAITRHITTATDRCKSFIRVHKFFDQYMRVHVAVWLRSICGMRWVEVEARKTFYSYL